MQKKSEFTIDGEVHQVLTNIPENFCEQVGHARASQLLGSFGIAHWVQAGVKRAKAIINEPSKYSEKVVAAAKAIWDKVIEGVALEIMDFVPAPRGEGKMVAEFRAKWPTATPEKRAAFLKAKGLDADLASEDVEDVLPFYIEWLEAKDDMGL